MDSGEDTKEDKNALLQIPLARVKRIIKSDPDVKLVSNDAVFLIAKSTELFLEYLAQEAYKETEKKKRSVLQYEDLAAAVRQHDELEFLSDIIPSKISAKGNEPKQTTLA